MQELHFTYESAEIRRALFRVMLQGQLMAVLLIEIWMPFMAVGAVTAAVVRSSATAILAAVLFVAVWCFATLSIFVRGPRKLAAESRERPFRMRAVPSGIEVHQGHSSWVLGLPDVTRVDETASGLIIHQRPRGFLFVPRRAFSTSDEMQAFRDHAASHLGDRAAARSGYGAVLARLAVLALAALVAAGLAFVMILNVTSVPSNEAAPAGAGLQATTSLGDPNANQGTTTAFERGAQEHLREDLTSGEHDPTVRSPGDADPLLLEVCAAHDEVVEQGVPPDRVLQATALRAITHHGATEAQLAELGARPAELLASIRERGSPLECDAMRETLEKRID